MKTSVAVLGATGVVGQKAIALLEQINEFEVAEVAASDRRIGEKFGDVVDWREPLSPVPERLRATLLSESKNLQSNVVISCLPQDQAKMIEPILAEQGKLVFSNASAFRMDPHVPLLVPEINLDHLDLVDKQSTRGKIITNPNCSVVGVTLALAPLISLGNLKHVSVVTLQSFSGAGYPGMSAFDMHGNTIPHIPEESEKIIEETRKILGASKKPLDLEMAVHVHRVPVMYGHTASLHLHFDKSISLEDVRSQYAAWNKKHGSLFVVHEELGRPQVLKDLTLHDDMRAHIGHIGHGTSDHIVSLVVLSHNLVRGAAGAAIANMRAYFKKKF
ncbi:MAG: aspartate-semialdehyde dehydrogenase [Bdellovibrionales bacterium]|nr:aspartate-semialdehyde dehydrogenase [Bdellovibrionales bacterium]